MFFYIMANENFYYAFMYVLLGYFIYAFAPCVTLTQHEIKSDTMKLVLVYYDHI